MKKAREQSIHKRTIRALVIMAIMLVPVCVFMVLGGMRLAKDRESAQIKLKLDALAQLVDNENKMYNAAVKAFDKNLAAHMNMMRASLGKLVSEDGYAGPRMLSDGFVVELRGDDVILPEGMPEEKPWLSRSIIEQSIKSSSERCDVLICVVISINTSTVLTAKKRASDIPSNAWGVFFSRISLEHIEIWLNIQGTARTTSRKRK